MLLFIGVGDPLTENASCKNKLLFLYHCGIHLKYVMPFSHDAPRASLMKPFVPEEELPLHHERVIDSPKQVYAEKLRLIFKSIFERSRHVEAVY